MPIPRTMQNEPQPSTSSRPLRLDQMTMGVNDAATQQLRARQIADRAIVEAERLKATIGYALLVRLNYCVKQMKFYLSHR